MMLRMVPRLLTCVTESSRHEQTRACSQAHSSACVCKYSVIGTQPRPVFGMSSVTACTLHGRAECLWPTKPQIFPSWPFIGSWLPWERW